MVSLAYLGNLVGPDMIIIVGLAGLYFIWRWVVRRDASVKPRMELHSDLETRLKMVEEKLERLGAK